MRFSPIRIGLAVLAIGLVGTVGSAHAAIQTKTDQIIRTNNVIALRPVVTVQLYFFAASPSCNVDLDGDGHKGRTRDRAYCTLNLIRWVGCGQGRWTQPLYAICLGATRNASEWRDFTDAFNDLVQRPFWWNNCIAVQVGSTVSPPYNWTWRSHGYECHNQDED